MTKRRSRPKEDPGTRRVRLAMAQTARTLARKPPTREGDPLAAVRASVPVPVALALRDALDRARAVMARAMDALEADDDEPARREAFELIQLEFEHVALPDQRRAEALLPGLKQARVAHFKAIGVQVKATGETIHPSVVRDLPGRPVAAPCAIGGCSYHDVENIHLVGVAEAAQMCGVLKPNFLRDIASRKDFPTPLATLACGPVWRREVLTVWLAVAQTKALKGFHGSKAVNAAARASLTEVTRGDQLAGLKAMRTALEQAGFSVRPK